jgi:putative endonuclease
VADTHKQQIGQIGENKAGEFLKKLGFRIIEKNYRKPWGEIDIIVQKGNDLRFVEVKTVSRDTLPASSDDYDPEENIHPWKRKRLRRVVETYLLARDLPDEVDWQVDAISVYLNHAREVLKIEHLEDVIV